MKFRRSILSLAFALSCVFAGVFANVADACGIPKPHPAGECGSPTPPPTATPMPPTPVPTVAIIPPDQPPVQPPAQVASPVQQSTSPSSPGSTSRTNVCVHTLENGNVRVDVKPITDANRWVAEHTGRGNLPDDFVPANGQMCGVTVLLPHPTPTTVATAVQAPPVPTIVLVPPVPIASPPEQIEESPPAVAQPCWQADTTTGEYVFIAVEDTDTGEITYVPVPCSSNTTPTTPETDTPTDLPRTGDPDALANCAQNDAPGWQQWWDYVGQYACP